MPTRPDPIFVAKVVLCWEVETGEMFRYHQAGNLTRFVGLVLKGIYAYLFKVVKSKEERRCMVSDEGQGLWAIGLDVSAFYEGLWRMWKSCVREMHRT